MSYASPSAPLPALPPLGDRWRRAIARDELHPLTETRRLLTVRTARGA